MASRDKPSSDETHLTWPPTPSGILIMGKRQGSKASHRELWGRVALAAALWHSAPEPKPYLLFVAADVHGISNEWDADMVKFILVDQYNISADYIIARRISNCTIVEVRAARVLRRVYGLSYIFAITHLYHAARVQRYFNEILSDVFVIPVHPDILAEIVFPWPKSELWTTIEQLIMNSLPNRYDQHREQIVEVSLNLIHTVDRRGRIERWLANFLRSSRRH